MVEVKSKNHLEAIISPCPCVRPDMVKAASSGTMRVRMKREISLLGSKGGSTVRTKFKSHRWMHRGNLNKRHPVQRSSSKKGRLVVSGTRS